MPSARALVESVMERGAPLVVRQIGRVDEAVSKKHFISVAAAIKAMPKRGITREQVANTMVRILRSENAAFDEKRFFTACGLTASGLDMDDATAVSMAHLPANSKILGKWAAGRKLTAGEQARVAATEAINEMAMGMTRMHFIAVAAAIRQLPKRGITKMQVAKALGDVFREENPQFDDTRFYTACGLNPRTMEPADEKNPEFSTTGAAVESRSMSARDLVDEIVGGSSAGTVARGITESTKQKKPTAKCRQCEKSMNPVDSLVGGGDKGKPICGNCARDNHKKAAGRG